jgi:ferritin-like protein
MSSEQLHEPTASLRAETMSRHRAITSLMEELQAVDWYDQRCDAEPDPALRAVIAHNRDEEKEHACMILEWLRRNDAGFDRFLRTYLFTDLPITEVETEASTGVPTSPGELGIGGLR